MKRIAEQKPSANKIARCCAALLAFCMLFCAACSETGAARPDASESAAEGSAPEASAAPAESDDAEQNQTGTTLRVLQSYAGSAKADEAYAAVFTALYPEIEIAYEYVYTDTDTLSEIEAALQQLRVDLASGTAADVIDAGLLSWHDLGNAGLLEDLEPYIAASEIAPRDAYVESMLDAMKTGEKLFVMPANISFHAVFLNRRALEEADLALGADGMISYSAYLDAFAACAALHPEMQGALGCGNNYLYPVAGVDFIDWGAREATFDSPEFISYLERTASLCAPSEAWDAVSGANGPTELISALQDDPFSCFSAVASVSEKSVGLFDGGTNSVTEPLLLTAEDGKSVFSVGSPYAIPSAGAHKQEAWTFLEFLETWTADASRTPADGVPLPQSVALPGTPYRAGILRSIADLFPEKDAADVDAMAARWIALCETAGHAVENSAELSFVLDEILGDFYNGQLSASDCAKQMQDRAWIWMQEQTT